MEKAVLVGVAFSKQEGQSLSATLDELASLAKTAGAHVVGAVFQNRDRPDSRTFIGKGKVQELHDVVLKQQADVVIVHNELSPAQERELEDALGIKVVNRTELILDIFAQHAHSREGKLQVEMAQTAYLQTRLTGKGVQMSRLGGGIGTRGPGETKLEVDRRRLRKKIALLRQALEKLERTRSIKREGRQRSGIPLVAIIGYTNAGKSTLLNAMTGAGVLVADQLFVTLDPTVRRVEVASGAAFLLVDTVGFVQDLPHSLIQAFRSTLEEVRYADLLLHVCDASHPAFASQMEAVRDTLGEIEADSKQTIVVFNKVDRLSESELLALRGMEPTAHFISAQKGWGVKELKQYCTSFLAEKPIN